ncbi:Hypothetical predicted protein [Xyrichtys novacula]|uniref:Uncharacterized protein n=1 Tax=Xyrichtys novacula TaxID=13765 RepID=A0AAV1HQ57_XYRNO|nr:Hypothetical predicted protein [Xyrichtys novacula]
MLSYTDHTLRHQKKNREPDKNSHFRPISPQNQNLILDPLRRHSDEVLLLLLRDRKAEHLSSSQIILQSLVCNYSTTICQLCNYHCEYANSV